MKFWDILRISIHNIFNNKLRTVLVWFMMFIMSTIILLVLTIGINAVTFFTNNINALQKEYQDITIAHLTNDKGEINGNFALPQIKQWENLIAEKLPQLNVITMYGGVSSVGASVILTDTDYNMFEGIDNYLLEGRIWTSADKNKAYAWINKLYADNYDVKVGESISIKINETNSELRIALQVVGIVDNVVPIKDYNIPNIICDNVFMQNKGAKVTFINFKEAVTGEGLNFSAWIKLKNFAKKYNDFDTVTRTGGVAVFSVADNYDLLFYILLAVIFVAVIIAFVVILLSIGAVANSIQITTEQNANFFGMMKAIGMRNSSMHFIIYMQTVLIIIAAILCATGATVGILSALAPWIISIFASIGAVGLILDLALPIWLPFVVFMVLVGMVILWTTKSLKDIDNRDVISMINEVGQ